MKTIHILLFITLFIFTNCSSTKKTTEKKDIVIRVDEPYRNESLKTSEIKYLALKGGGVKGIAYAGALKVLDDEGIYDNIEKVAGTSAGSIVSCLIALKYPVQDKSNSNVTTIESIIEALDLKKFEDHKSKLRVITKYGLYKGQYFLNWMEDRVVGSPLGLPKKATFKDLHDKGGMDLHVYSCNINTHSLQEFSYAVTPNIPIAEAVRASMSIPMFFSAWQFPGGQFNNHLFVDGGMMMNYPITAFDDHSGPNPTTLGLYLGTKDDDNPAHAEFGHRKVVDYVKNTFITIRQSQHAHFMTEENDVQRTVFIDDFDLSGVDFNISKATQDSLLMSGIRATQVYLKQNGMME